MKTNEVILLDNPLIYAVLLYEFCKKMQKCELMYPFLILPLVTDDRYNSMINSKNGKKELLYLIRRLKGSEKESFYTEYNQIIIRKKAIVFDALKLCIDNNLIAFANEGTNTFLVAEKSEKWADEKDNNLVKSVIKVAEICRKNSISQFISAMKVRI